MIRQISINKNKRGVKPRKKGVNHRFFVINDFLKEVVDKRNIHFHNHIQISHQNKSHKWPRMRSKPTAHGLLARFCTGLVIILHD